MNLICFANHLNSLLSIFYPYSFILSLFLKSDSNPEHFGFFAFESDSNPEHFGFFAFDFNISNKISSTIFSRIPLPFISFEGFFNLSFVPPPFYLVQSFRTSHNFTEFHRISQSFNSVSAHKKSFSFIKCFLISHDDKPMLPLCLF